MEYFASAMWTGAILVACLTAAPSSAGAAAWPPFHHTVTDESSMTMEARPVNRPFSTAARTAVAASINGRCCTARLCPSAGRACG
jgi:hypothetical protein